MARFVALFGAGASFGSDSWDVTPPLGEGLFDALATYKPTGWGMLDPNLATAFKEDFEAGMRLLSETRPQAMSVLQRAMAEYFFQFRPRPQNLYTQLARNIAARPWDGALVTLNYERLLELSLLREGVQPVVNQEGISPKQVELCLPHGCCHLFCDSVRGKSAVVSFDGRAVSTNGPVSTVSNPEAFRQRIEGDAFPPVMSYFEPQKRTTAGTGFINKQRSRFSQLIEQADVVVIVGVAPRDTDTHIWGPLANAPARLIYCSGKRAASEFHSWAGRTRPGKPDRVVSAYFAESFSELVTELGLR